MGSKQYVATSSVPGKYKMLTHEYGLDHTKKEYAKPVDVVLDATGNISGAVSGKWSQKDGTSYFNVTINGQVYKGVLVEQYLEPKSEKAPSFTVMCAATGVTIWGYRVSN